ncbi:MAG: biopolymer transporter ExbD [Acidobacteriota bacterium]
MAKLEPMAATVGRGGRRRGRTARVSSSLSEINVVPLVDVMLVLLIIFMVAAPMMTQGFPVRLPESSRSAAVTAPITVTVPLTFRRDHRVHIDDQVVTLDALEERIRQALDGRAQKSVMLAGDGGVTLDELMAVADRLKAGGVVNLNLQTQPPNSR